jgi:hypothetical protein
MSGRGPGFILIAPRESSPAGLDPSHPKGDGKETRRIGMDEPRPTPTLVETFIEQARSLDDHDRWALAEARGAVDEAFHVGAWRAANEMVVHRAEAYVEARIHIGAAFIPDRLEELLPEGSKADPAEVAEWQEVARLTRIGMDDALLALLGTDSITPLHVRELYRPWKAMLAVRHQRGSAESPPPDG